MLGTSKAKPTNLIQFILKMSESLRGHLSEGHFDMGLQGEHGCVSLHNILGDDGLEDAHQELIIRVDIHGGNITEPIKYLKQEIN
jgi:hypothetical protein